MTAITDISKRKYDGYIWFSDQKKPVTLIEEEYSFEDAKENPFVIEALLWNAEEEISIMVRHTGKYHIQEFKLNELSAESKLEDKFYLPHRLNENVKHVCFKQLWIPEPDALCEGMSVMTMKALIFTGFKYSTEKN